MHINAFAFLNNCLNVIYWLLAEITVINFETFTLSEEWNLSGIELCLYLCIYLHDLDCF